MSFLFALALGLLIFVFQLLPVAAQSGVIINELMWDGVEYIELYNPSAVELPLAGWKLTRQKPASAEQLIVEFTDDDVIPAQEYFLLEQSEEATDVPAHKVVASLVLVNTGELVRLYDDNGVVADTANQLGAWFAGKNTDSGISMERAEDAGEGTSAASWHDSVGTGGGRTGTPGTANSASADRFDNPATPSPGFFSNEVVINEWLPNPVGSDTKEEFIELYNTGSEAVDLSGWQLDDSEGGSKLFTIEPGLTLAAGGYAVFKSDQTKISLNNNGDQVRLFSPDEVVRQQVEYSGSMAEGVSVNRVADTYQHSTTATPGSVNIITAASSEMPADEANEEAGSFDFSTTVLINEFLPNPAGADAAGEFIEIINLGSKEIGLAGWQLDDGEGGSLPYAIPADVRLPAGGILALRRGQTKIALNNDRDTVRLIDPASVIVSSFTYTDPVAEGVSYNRAVDGGYRLSATVTEGKPNVITTLPGRGLIAGGRATFTSIDSIRSFKHGSIVSITGVVSAPPNVLGKNTMYLAGSGVQVYLSSGTLPASPIGSHITLTGEVSSLAGETRIKVSSPADIAVTSQAEAPQPQVVKTGDIGEAVEGFLVTTAGIVTRSSGATFYINDGSGDAKVVVKESTGIHKPKTSRGLAVAVTGVISQTQSGYRILPRFPDDLAVAGAATRVKNITGAILGVEQQGEASQNLSAIRGAGRAEAGVSSRQVVESGRALSRSGRLPIIFSFLVGMAAAQLINGVRRGEPLWQTKVPKKIAVREGD